MKFNNLIEVLEQRAATDPGKELYRFISTMHPDGEKISIGELAKQAKSIAAVLQLRLKPGDRALLIYPPGLELIKAYFGCLYAGVIAVPVYPPLNLKLTKKLQLILEDASPAIVLTSQDLAKKFKKLKILKVLTKVSLIKSITKKMAPLVLDLTQWDMNLTFIATDTVSHRYEKKWKVPDISPDHVVFLQYTSGSTGNPKGVMVSHMNLLHNLELMQESFGVNEKSILFSWLPPYHDMGLIGNILEAVYANVLCILMSPLDFLSEPFLWLKSISKYKVTESGGPNFSYEYCVRKITAEQKLELDLSSWRVAFNGAEPIHADTLEQFFQAFKACGFERAVFKPCYGLAEATLVVSGPNKSERENVEYFSSTHLKKHIVKKVSSDIGKPIVNCGVPLQEIKIVDPVTKMELPPGEIGEIWIRSPSVTQGYWERPALTKKIFQAKLNDGLVSYLRSGDLGFIFNNSLYVTGRKKDLIIIGGKNYYPHDIEKTVNHSHAEIRRGNCVAFSIGQAEEKLIVMCETKVGMEEKLYEDICSAIQHHIVSEHSLLVDTVVLIPPKTLLKTTSGKVRRKPCAEAFINKTLLEIVRWKSKADLLGLLNQAPENKRQEILINYIKALIENALGHEGQHVIGLDDSFFEMGLDSLMALQIRDSLHQGLGETCTISDGILLRCDTVRTLGDEIFRIYQEKFSE